MRWLFFIVFIINIVYIVWQLSTPDVTEVTDDLVVNDTRTIILLSEREKFQDEVEDLPGIGGIEEPVQVVDEVAAIEIHKDKVLQGDVCYTVGPFQELGQLRSFMQEIKSYVEKAEFRNREEKSLTVYWVYVTPEKTRKAARELGKRLKANKIKDFYIIRTGEKNNGISLGHFKDKYRATKLTEKVKKLGFDVLVEPVYKPYTVYWLDYQIASDKNIPAAIFDKYTKSTTADKISRIKRECAL